MNVLALDTATPSPSVCLLARGDVFEEALSSDRRASEELLPAIRRLLSAADLTLQECGRIAVCAGPGSFTGVRVGLATAWGLGRALGVTVEAVSTLEALAETARGSAGPRVVAALDAGRGELICETFALEPERARSLGPAQLVPQADAVPGTISGGSSVAAALARAVARAPRPTASAVAAIYSRPSAAEEKRGAS